MSQSVGGRLLVAGVAQREYTAYVEPLRFVPRSTSNALALGATGRRCGAAPLRETTRRESFVAGSKRDRATVPAHAATSVARCSVATVVGAACAAGASAAPASAVTAAKRRREARTMS